MNVCIINGSSDYRRLFEKMGWTLIPLMSETSRNATSSSWKINLKNADLVVFTGGADVSPNLYGDKKHQYTGNDPVRDENESEIFTMALDEGIPMVGICRGGQFLNVMSGGRMYQDVTGHGGSHEIVDAETGETVYVSSTHHQMMMPSKQGKVVATSRGVTSNREWFDAQVFKRDVNTEGIEVVYYDHTRSLCFQPHPEFDGVHFGGMKNYFKSLLERFKMIKTTQVACSC
jgi:gamma-glutamyl-gamma-aminobutyrate hydrolase PuuD